MCKTSSPGCARALVSDPSRCGDAAWARPPPSWLARGTRVSQASSWTRPLRRLSRLRSSWWWADPRGKGGPETGRSRTCPPSSSRQRCVWSPPRCGTERGSICTSAAPSMRRPLAKCPRSSPQRSATPSCGHTIPSAYRRPSAGRTRWSTSRATTTPVGPLPSSTPLPPSSPPSWRCLQKKSCRCRATQPATYCRSCRRSPWGGVRAYALPLRPQPSSAAGRHLLQKGGCRGPITAAATVVRLLAAHRTC
mmetsp:Transcript_7199/g.23760  ORF Transcript_7199/g.23760 Transcript_7199/m.23760 type:complete len:250 (-) Transcript_7199:232-981(-)